MTTRMGPTAEGARSAPIDYRQYVRVVRIGDSSNAIQFSLPGIQSDTRRSLLQRLNNHYQSLQHVPNEWKTPSIIHHLALTALNRVEDSLESSCKADIESGRLNPLLEICRRNGSPFIAKNEQVINGLFQEAYTRNLLPQLHSIFMNNPRCFLLKNEDNHLSFPFLNINECTCPPAGTHDRFDNPCRLSIENDVIEKIASLHPNREEELQLVSLGPGEYLQDWMILSRLHQMSYKKAVMIFIDPNFNGMSQELKNAPDLSILSPEQIEALETIENEYLDILARASHMTDEMDHINRLDLIKEFAKEGLVVEESIEEGLAVEESAEEELGSEELEEETVLDTEKWQAMKDYFSKIGMDVSFCSFPSLEGLKKILPDFHPDAIWAIDFDDYQAGSWATLRNAIQLYSSPTTGIHMSFAGSILDNSPTTEDTGPLLNLKEPPNAIQTLLEIENFRIDQETVRIQLGDFGLELSALAIINRLLRASPQVNNIEIILNFDWENFKLTNELEKELFVYTKWLQEFFQMTLPIGINWNCRLEFNTNTDFFTSSKNLRVDISLGKAESPNEVHPRLSEIPRVYVEIAHQLGVCRKNPRNPGQWELIPSVSHFAKTMPPLRLAPATLA